MGLIDIYISVDSGNNLAPIITLQCGILALVAPRIRALARYFTSAAPR